MMRQAISTIQEAVKKASANGITLTEAMTETIVIDPILAALGYAVWEYQKQGITAGVGNVPDYIVLPKTAYQWFQEVKKWRFPLTEREANQTVSYAFGQGARWAVLTNGDEWRIYDAHNQAPLAQKCLLTFTSLSAAMAVEVLSLLAKTGIVAGDLAAFHRRHLLTAAIRTELTSLQSATIRAIRKAVECPMLPGVTREEVQAVVHHLLAAPQDASMILVADRVAEPTVPYVLSTLAEYPLTELALRRPSPAGRPPEAVRCPDGTVLPMTTWRQLAQDVIAWCAAHHGLPPLPFSGMQTVRPSKYFLASQPAHPDGRRGYSWTQLNLEGVTIYVDLHHSARGFCRLLKALLLAVGVDPTTVTVQLKSADTRLQEAC